MVNKIISFALSIVTGIIVLFISFFTVFGKASAEEITILFTHDLHDNLYPHEVEVNGENIFVGGYARLMTAIEEERSRHERTILVDAGDYAMGTLFQTIFSTHSPTLRLLGQLEYDAITIGNHEFDFRAQGLADSLRAAIQSGDAVPEIVASNVVYPKDENGQMAEDISSLKEAMDEYGVKDYLVIERDGIKIGLFGLMGKDADSNAPMSGVEFSDMIEAAKEVVEQLQQEGVDLIVALSHSGTSDNKKNSEDEILAEEVPEIDVIISGHTHTFLYEPIVINDTVIGSTGEYGQNLGIMTLRKNSEERWDLVNYELKQIDDSIAPNKEMEEKIEQFKQIVQEDYLNYFQLEFNQVLAYSPFNVTDFKTMSDRHAEDPLGNLIGDAYIMTVEEHDDENADPITAAVVPVGTIRNTFNEGEITVSDVFNVSSLGIGPDKISGYPIVEVYLAGKELKTIAEVDASVSPIMPSAQLYVAGLSYTFNPNRLIFNKVTDVKIQRRDGSIEEIVDDKLYRIVAGLYSGQMLPVVSEKSFGLLSLVPKKKDGTPITDFEEHIMYMNDGTNREIKEWYAIANYLSSFPIMDRLPEIPEYYSQLQNRKVVDDSKNIVDLLKKPNGIALTIYGIGLFVILLFVFIIRFAVRRRKKKQQLNKRKAI